MEEEDVHAHCQTCYTFSCCPRALEGDLRVGCPFHTCQRAGCGAVFHECKAEEHDLLCRQMEVACVNVEYGCPAKMKRAKLAQHLSECPASLVVCMAEWNRRPVAHAQPRRRWPVQRVRNPYSHRGQLDHDLMARDERMLARFDRLGRRTRVILRNSLTRRHPAVPLADDIVRTITNDKKDNVAAEKNVAIFEESDNSSSVLSKQMQRWKRDLDERVKDREVPRKYWESPELEKGNVHKHCAHCFKADCQKEFDAEAPAEERACAVVHCRWGCGARLHACKLFEHQMVCALYEEQDEFAWMFRGFETANRNRKMRKGKKDDGEESLFDTDLLVGPGVAAHAHKARSGRGRTIPAPPQMPKSVQRGHRLDIRLDTVTRLQAKPAATYTFVCGQTFRRDEFAGHSKTVHSDIIGGGLDNNWMEHRCPLAVYGCPFAVRRLRPMDDQHDLRFSRVQESFAVKSRATLPKKKRTSSPCLSLTDLPAELLLEIFRQLDSFSLNSLSLTCLRLRDVCCSFLEERGCVAPQWAKYEDEEGRIRWRVAYLVRLIDCQRFHSCPNPHLALVLQHGTGPCGPLVDDAVRRASGRALEALPLQRPGW